MAIVSISEGRMESALWYIIFSAIFDFLDGKMARIFRTQSKLGPQIDSLADAVSFGVAPAFYIYSFVVFQVGRFSPFYLLPFVYLSAAIMRLARFNVIGVDSQREFYYGLSSPLSALFVTSFIYVFNRYLPQFLLFKEIIAIVVILFSFLMLSRIEFPVFKATRRSEKIQILFFAAALILLVVFKGLFLMIAIGVYVIYGIVFNLLRRDNE